MTTPSVADLPDIALPQEVADVLRVSRVHIHNLVKSGALKGKGVGRVLRIRREWVRQYLEEAKPCPNETEESSSNGAKTAGPGKSSGSNAANADAVHAARLIAEKLTSSSRSPSRANGPPAPVIHLGVRSRKSSRAT